MDEQQKLQIQAQQTPRALLVKLTGDIDSDQADELDRELRMLSEVRPATPRVVLDLSGVGFVASVGMGVIVRFRQTMAQSKGTVVLASLRPLVMDAFKRAGLDRLFAFQASAHDAAPD